MNETKTALQRGQELLELPSSQLPKSAWAYMQFLAMNYGMCTEVCLSAFTAYAQCVENLPCYDDNYKASDGDKKWFEKQLEMYGK